MAITAGSFSTHSAIGIREDLTDVIYNISPTATPFMTNAGRGKAKQTYHEWQTDSLAAADTNNNRVEGNEATYSEPATTTRLGNYTQISDKTVLITGTLESVNKAGRDRELAYQLAKRSKELKRDMEAILTANQARSAGGGSPVTARKLGSLGSFIATNDVFNSASSPTPGASPTTIISTARTDAGNTTALTEANLNTAIRNAWTQGGEPNMIMCGPFNKTKITAFVGATGSSLYQNSGDRTRVNAVDYYESDFGTMSVVPNRFQRERDVWVLDMDMWSVVYLRDFQTHEMAKTGDGEKRLLNVEYTLCGKQEAASAGVFDCTTS